MQYLCVFRKNNIFRILAPMFNLLQNQQISALPVQTGRSFTCCNFSSRV